MSKIKNVVFDMGKVLVDFTNELFINHLLESGAQFQDPMEVYRKAKGFDHEKGLISPEEFLGNIQNVLGTELEIEPLALAWSDVFTPFEDMIMLAKKLRASHRVFILSNADPMRWQNLETKFQVSSWADGILTSFEAGLMKPDARIYKLAEERFNLTASESVFIDDLLENVNGACAIGWHGIHHKDHDSTVDELHTLGVL